MFARVLFGVFLGCSTLNSTTLVAQLAAQLTINQPGTLTAGGRDVPLKVSIAENGATPVPYEGPLTWKLTPASSSVKLDSAKGVLTLSQAGTIQVTATATDLHLTAAPLSIYIRPLPSLTSFDLTDKSPVALKKGEKVQLKAIGRYGSGADAVTRPISTDLQWSIIPKDESYKISPDGTVTSTSKSTNDVTVVASFTGLPDKSVNISLDKAGKPRKAVGAIDEAAPAVTTEFYSSFIGGAEQVSLSSLPSQTEPFLRVYLQSGSIDRDYFHARQWAALRLLGAPTQSDTNGIYSVFTDPTGQITSQKLSSIGTSVDFMFGPALRVFSFDTKNSIDVVVGFGATTPLQSNKVTQAFVVPAFGTAECNILYNKFGSEFTQPAFEVQKSTNGMATGGVTNACLLNTNAATTNNGTTTYAPINTLAFSNQDKASFFLKDMLGLRFNHTVKSNSAAPDCDKDKQPCSLGALDFSFGQDAAITGGVLRGNLWVFKADGVYPIVVKDVATLYLFGSFITRLKRNRIDNNPLILQPGSLTTLTGTGTGSVPNMSTIVLPLRQPDRDFYRIGVGIDILGFIKSKTGH